MQGWPAPARVDGYQGPPPCMHGPITPAHLQTVAQAAAGAVGGQHAPRGHGQGERGSGRAGSQAVVGQAATCREAYQVLLFASEQEIDNTAQHCQLRYTLAAPAQACLRQAASKATVAAPQDAQRDHSMVAVQDMHAQDKHTRRQAHQPAARTQVHPPSCTWAYELCYSILAAHRSSHPPCRTCTPRAAPASPTRPSCRRSLVSLSRVWASAEPCTGNAKSRVLSS